jgi:hypothetical protein
MSEMMNEEGNISNFTVVDEEPLLCGYLYKKTRDGRWQKRWFQTSGEYLIYYKVFIHTSI